MPRLYSRKTGWGYDFIKTSSVYVILVSRIKMHLNDDYKFFHNCILHIFLAEMSLIVWKSNGGNMNLVCLYNQQSYLIKS